MKLIFSFTLIILSNLFYCQTSKIDPYFVETFDTVASYGPINITRHILEDKKGNIWLATWQGIMKYDGKVFTNYTLKNNLIHFHVYSIMEDRAGNIWFGTIRGGAYKYDGKYFTLITTYDGLADDFVGNMLEDKTGHIWFGTESGLSRFDTSANYRLKTRNAVTITGLDLTTKKGFTNYTTNEGLCNDRVNTIMQDKTGKMWIGTREGVSCYDGSTFSTFVIAPDFPFTNVRSIKQVRSGKIWIGGQEGLYCYDPNAIGDKQMQKLFPNFIGYIFEDKAGNLWLSAGEKKGMSLYKYDGTTFTKILEKNIDGDQQVFETTEDKNGNIWLGTMRGCIKYDGKTFKQFPK